MNLARILGITVFASVIASFDNAHAGVTFVQSGGTLKVTGDAADDEIALFGNQSSGSVSLSIGPTLTATFERVRDIAVNSGAGNDLVFVVGIQIGGSVKIKTGVGVDHVGILGDGGQTVRELFIAKNIDVSTGGQVGDNVELTTDTKCGASIGGNVVVRGASKIEVTGSFGSTASDAADFRIGGNLRIDAVVPGSSLLALTGANVHGTTSIRGGGQSDLVRLERCHFLGNTSIQALGGDDVVTFDNGISVNRFGASVLVDGGAGSDTSNAASFGIFAIEPKLKGVETAN